jgi:hypothetical protein
MNEKQGRYALYQNKSYPHQIEQIVQVAVTMELDNMPLTEECYKENLE